MKTIRPGMRFKNGIMDLTVLCFTETENTNLALVICSNDGLFITVRNLSKWQGQHTWDWGHYFSGLRDALDDYEIRKKIYNSIVRGVPSTAFPFFTLTVTFSLARIKLIVY